MIYFFLRCIGTDIFETFLLGIYSILSVLPKQSLTTFLPPLVLRFLKGLFGCFIIIILNLSSVFTYSDVCNMSRSI